MKDDKNKIESLLSRRSFLRSASAVGLGTAVLSYQNCSPVNFSGRKELPSEPEPPTPVDVKGCRNPVLPFDYPFYGEDGMINGHAIYTQDEPGSFGATADRHRLNVGFWSTAFYDQGNGTNNNLAYILTVDVGRDPQNNDFAPMASSNFAAGDAVTDVYVFEDQTGVDENGEPTGSNVLLHWHRFGSGDYQPSVMIVLAGDLVAGQPKLKVIARFSQSGYWMEELDLSLTAPMNYSSAVPTANTAVKYAGTTMYRPYVAQSAVGGQTLNVVQHTPTIQVINNNTVDVILGNPNARHGIASTSHYPAGAMLFDQEGHRLGEHVVLNIASAGAAHVFRFTNLNLSERNVKVLRAVVQDTGNGHMMGFKVLANG